MRERFNIHGCAFTVIIAITILTFAVVIVGIVLGVPWLVGIIETLVDKM